MLLQVVSWVQEDLSAHSSTAQLHLTLGDVLHSSRAQRTVEGSTVKTVQNSSHTCFSSNLYFLSFNIYRIYNFSEN